MRKTQRRQNIRTPGRQGGDGAPDRRPPTGPFVAGFGAPTTARIPAWDLRAGVSRFRDAFSGSGIAHSGPCHRDARVRGCSVDAPGPDRRQGPAQLLDRLPCHRPSVRTRPISLPCHPGKRVTFRAGRPALPGTCPGSASRTGRPYGPPPFRPAATVAVLPLALVGEGLLAEFAHGLDRFGAGLRREDDRTALVAEGGPHLAGEVLQVGRAEQLVAVHEQQEGRWSLPDLGSVVEPEPVTLVADRLAPLDGVIDRAVEDRRGHLMAQLAGHVAHGLEQAVELEAVLGRGEDDRRVVQEEEPLLHPLAELGQRREALLTVVPVALLQAPGPDLLLAGLADIRRHQVPLVDHDDAGAAGLDDDVGDLLVLLSDPVERVDDEHGDVAAGDGILGAFDREILDRVVDAPGLAHAGGVDQHIPLAARLRDDLEGHVDGVPGRARNRADDDPLSARQAVDDRRLAHVGTSHDGQASRAGRPARAGGLGLPGLGAVRGGDLGRVLRDAINRPRPCPCPGIPRRQETDGRVHQVLDAAAVDGRHREDPLEPERREFPGACGGLVVVGLVDHHDHRLLDGPQLLGDLLVERNDAFLDIDDQEDDIGRFDGQVHLLQRGGRDDILGLLAPEQADASGVDEGVGTAMPLCLGHHPVPGDARLVVDDGDAPADDPVEESRLADVGATHDGDET